MFAPSDIINSPTHLICSDGLNEKGLSVAMLYQSYTTELPRYSTNATKVAVINFMDLTAFLLARYSSVAEVAEDLKHKVQVVWNPQYNKLGMLVSFGVQRDAPMHFTVHDASGASLVVQFRPGGVTEVLDNPLGVFANGAFLQDHYKEYKSWLNRHNYTEQQPPNGTMWIMPGDYSSSSRFIRMAMLSTAAQHSCWSTQGAGELQQLSPGTVPKGYPTTNPTLLAVVGMLQSVYLPRGIDDEGGANSKEESNIEVTPVSTLRDHKAAIYYYR
eukprot:gene12809-12937_t